MTSSATTDGCAQLEQELIEKIEIGSKYVTSDAYHTFASDIISLFHIAMYSPHITHKARLEKMNTRMAQYLDNYVPFDAKFPKHVMKELGLFRSYFRGESSPADLSHDELIEKLAIYTRFID